MDITVRAWNRVLCIIEIAAILILSLANFLLVLRYDFAISWTLTGASLLGMFGLVALIRYYMLNYYTIRAVQTIYFAGLITCLSIGYSPIYGTPLLCVIVIYELKYDHIFMDTVELNFDYERQVRTYRVNLAKLRNMVDEFGGQDEPGEQGEQDVVFQDVAPPIAATVAG